MIAVALKGLAGRKVRALLTAFAVVIGVSMVSGTFILTDTMQKSFDGLFDGVLRQHRRRHQRQGDRQDSTERQRRHDPGSRCSTKVRALPEVEAAGGAVSPAGGQRRRHHRPRRQDGRAGERRRQHRPRQRAASARSSSRRARWPQGPDQVVDRRRHRRQGALRVGDTVGVATAGHEHPYEITGTASFGDVDSLGFAQHRGLGRRDRAGAARIARAATTRSRSPPRRARRRPSSSAPSSRSSRHSLRGQGQRQAGRRGRRRAQRGHGATSATSCSASAASRCSSARS